jgi:hypothetical protein
MRPVFGTVDSKMLRDPWFWVLGVAEILLAIGISLALWWLTGAR